MGKRIFSKFSLLVFLVLLLGAGGVSAQVRQVIKKKIVKISGEHIREYKVQIRLEKDAVLRVEERIRYDFGQAQRRGIYRDIPFIFENKDGKKYKLKISDIKVVDEQGVEYTKKIFEKGEVLRIRVGDPEVYVSGVKEYNISYSLQGGVLYRDEYDQVLFNLIGNFWNVPILEAAGEFEFGFPVDLGKVEVSCFVGKLFSTSSSDCQIQQNKDGFEFRISRMLNPFEGVTIDLRFPKGWVQYNPAEEYVPLSERGWFQVLVIVLLILTLIFLFFWYVFLPFRLYLEWRKSGRDPDIGLGKVRAWFSPPKTSSGRQLSPLEVGALVDEKLDNKDIAALIVDLARRGYIKIKEVKRSWGGKDFQLTSRAAADDKLFDFEKSFLRKIFALSNKIYVSDISFSFKEYDKWLNQIYEHLVREGFMADNPIKIRKRYIYLILLSSLTFNFPLLFSTLIFGMHMARKTEKGVEVKLMAEGFREFLKTQKRRIKFVAEKDILFEKLLPYAIALDVLDEFMKIFPQEVYANTTGWYSGSADLSLSLGNLSSLSSKVVYSATSGGGSYGGGFSGAGGGVGGGGGGSW